MKLFGLFGRSKDLMRYFTASLLAMIVSLALNPFVSVCMTKGDFAITGYYTSFNLLVLPLVGFSLMQYYNKSYFRLDNAKRDKLLNTIISTTLLFGGISLVLFCTGYYVFHNDRNIDLPYFPYAILFFSSVYLLQFYSAYQTKLKFEKNSKRFLRIAIYYTAAHLLCVVLFVLLWKMGALGYAIATFGTSLIVMFLSIPFIITKFEIDKTMLRQALAFSWPLILANMMEYVYSGIDRSFLVGINNNDGLGLYNVAVTIGSYVTIFYTTVSQTFQPDLFEAVAMKNIRSTVRVFFKIQILNIVPIVLFIVLAPFIIDLLTFGRYVECTPYARIIALKGIFAAFYFSLSSIIIASGLSKISLGVKIAGTTVTYFMFDVLISRYAYYGAAWGQALSYVSLGIISLALIWFFHKRIFA